MLGVWFAFIGITFIMMKKYLYAIAKKQVKENSYGV